MAEIFLKKDVETLLNGKKVLLLGDSNVRALYKDLVWLFKCNTLIDSNVLKRRVSKLENQFLGDNLVRRSELTRGRDFTEHRLFKSDCTHIEFIFITRCYSKIIEDLFCGIKDGKRDTPDVVYMNSCLWDISRWGPNGVKEYQGNMRNLMKLLTESLPSKTLFIWGTATPTAKSTSGGLIIKQLEFLQAALRVHVMEANKFTSSLVSSYGFDVLDGHHFMHYQVLRRSADGIHYLPHATRFMTNLLLTHIALSWDMKLPQRIRVFPGPLEKILRAANQAASEKVEGMVKKMDGIASTLINIGNPPGNSPGKRNKKKKNRKKKRHLKQPSVMGQERSKTPPMYHKAQNPVFNSQRISAPSFSFDSSNFDNSSSFNDLSFSEDTFVRNFEENNFHPANTATTSNQRMMADQTLLFNYCNYFNDPYTSVKQQFNLQNKPLSLHNNLQNYPQNYPLNNPQNYPQNNPQNYPQNNPQNYPQNNPQNYPQNNPQNYPQNYGHDYFQNYPQLVRTVWNIPTSSQQGYDANHRTNNYQNYNQPVKVDGIDFGYPYSEQRYVNKVFPTYDSSRNRIEDCRGGGAMRSSGNKRKRHTPYRKNRNKRN